MQRSTTRIPAAAVREAVSCADVLAAHGYAAQRRGPCPICGTSDRSQAFCLYGDRFETFRCFACNAGGDAITLEMALSGGDFQASLEVLASRAGIAPGTSDPTRDSLSRLRQNARKDAAAAISRYRTSLARAAYREEQAAEAWQRASLEAETVAEIRAANARAAVRRAAAARADKARG